ncbi:N-acetylmuramic acid 6-phosphate etherase [Aureimonas altamirensis]|uniref:N-acetylmuramic acid 6-phosphate etherase n=1 Tax=Aureimonas altamirensis TaxID=370622 RepID=UPI002036A075|nr:N-acetylmuramic acid 6-phosphate etherase [Aureimonas altamirensis]MCM2502645.1 N-acetylmuramic acid 6-phosphate etherase [Aureimonas altamirensis]
MTDDLRATEALHPASRGLDMRSDTEALGLLLAGQRHALAAVESAVPALAEAAELALDRLAAGGRLVYLAAGSPALIALGDALEIPQTYGEPASSFITILAGGAEIVTKFGGGAEDDRRQAEEDVLSASVGPTDCVVAISASGSTPYVLRGLEACAARGAATVAIANNPDAPIFRPATVSVLLDTGPELVAGSTRLGAGTAQKAALNMLSTLIAIRRGHVHDGHMVGLRADNDKLRARAIRMVCDMAGASPQEAAEALRQTDDEVKPAVLLAAGANDIAAARQRLEKAGGSLRQALAALRN